MNYREIGLKVAYKLQNAGGLVLICTKGNDGRYDLAPVAWCCPLDYDPVSRFLCVLDTGHRTFKDLVMSCGSVSGTDVDKYQKFGIEAFAGSHIDVKIPAGVSGWIECSLSGLVVEGTSAIVMGDALHAEAVESAWKERIHFVSDGLLFIPGKSEGS
jgi:flavin reductase (DIM6/NTAB) family NADH-FMN oxidoreductase RutF